MSGMAYIYDGISLQNGRNVNMDSLLLKCRRVRDTELCMATVCDGVGSLADGAFAASSAARMLSNWFENLEDTDRLGLRLRDYVSSVNLAIATKARSKQMETACTLSCLLLWDGQYCVVHVGDSRIYLWQDGALRQLTRDQVREGRLTSVVGHRTNTDIFYTEGVREDGQRFLLCSDGLYKRMDSALLAAAMQRLSRRNLQKTLRQLTDYVIDQGEQDNVSVALLMNDER